MSIFEEWQPLTSMDEVIQGAGFTIKASKFDFFCGRLSLVMPLTAKLIQMAVIQKVTAVLTENEILLFNPNGSLRFDRGLPDFPEQFSTIGNNLVIQLVEGDRFSLNLETGQFQKLVGEVLVS